MFISSAGPSCVVNFTSSYFRNRKPPPKAKQSLARVIGAFNYNLPGGVQVNTTELTSMAQTEMQEVMDMINGENTPSYFLQWN